MATYSILMSNLGYARGISGCLADHIRYAHRHVYCPQDVQENSLKQLKSIIEKENPDLCCFVEIDKGSFSTANFNQLNFLLSEHYTHFDIENKYDVGSARRRMPLSRGKSNAFMARQAFPHEKIYFTHGVKKLIYKIQLSRQCTLFFAHFSLRKDVRAQQLQQVKTLFHETEGEIIFLGDFNLLNGLDELKPLLAENLILLNRAEDPTFTFHRKKLVLDLCLCSKRIAESATLGIIPQPYSDHAALLLKAEIA